MFTWIRRLLSQEEPALPAPVGETSQFLSFASEVDRLLSQAAFDPTTEVHSDEFGFGDMGCDNIEWSSVQRFRHEFTAPEQSGKVRNPDFPKEREYVFPVNPEDHVITAPITGLYVPRPLTADERQAVKMTELLVGLKPNPKLKKKIADLDKGQRWVRVEGKKLIDINVTSD